jgi:hypothetical protein
MQVRRMTFELWDMRSRNAIGGFDSKAAALAAVRQLIEDHGRSYVDDLFLGCEDDQGNSTPIAKGQQLADLALSAAQRSTITA